MSYTNHTTNYNLPQYVGTDKPTYLGDFNTAMSAIDAQMKLNADSASTAGTNATTANTNIGTLASLTTEEKTNLVGAINEVDSNADTAQNSANTASNTATQALNKANSALDEVAKFDLDNAIPLTVTTNLGSVLTNTLKVVKDDTNSVYKFYGQLTIGSLNGVTGSITLTITPTSGLNPSEAYDVECGSTIYVSKTDGHVSIGNRKFTVNTDGTITIPNEPVDGVTSLVTWILPPCVYFNKSFGD